MVSPSRRRSCLFAVPFPAPGAEDGQNPDKGVHRHDRHREHDDDLEIGAGEKLPDPGDGVQQLVARNITAGDELHRADGLALDAQRHGAHDVALADGRGQVVGQLEGLLGQFGAALAQQQRHHIVGRVEHDGVGLGRVDDAALGDGLGGIQRRGDGVGGEHPVHQGAGLQQGGAAALLVGGVGHVEHYADVAFAVLRVPAGKVLPLAQAAGLAAAGVGAVVAAAGTDHAVGVLDDVGARRGVVGVGAHIVGGRGHDLGHDVVRGQRAQNQVGVAGRRHVAFVQAAGVGEGGGGAADGRGFLVHAGDKVIDAAAAHIVRHDVGGLVGAGQQHGVQQVAQRLGVAAADVGCRGVGRLFPDQVIDIPGRGERDGVQLVLVAFQQQQAGHHLGQAGGLELGLAVFLIDDDVGVEVDDVGSRGRQGRGVGGKGAVLPFRRCRHGQHQRQHQRAQQGAEFFHRQRFLGSSAPGTAAAVRRGTVRTGFSIANFPPK